MKYNRRNFIALSGLASTAILIPDFLKAFEKVNRGFLEAANGKKLVVIQLSGGNDGLNTVVPYRNDIYYSGRQGIAVQQNQVLTLNDELGLNPNLTALKGLFDNSNLAIINNVGYPNPDRSHFRSMDIWQTASGSDQYIKSGWIGRFLDAQCADCNNAYHAIEVDDTLSLAMKGENKNGIALRDPKRLYSSTAEQYFADTVAEYKKNGSVADTNLNYLYKTMVETLSSADYIYKESKIYQSQVVYPQTDFAKNLKTVAELIVGGIDTNVFYVSLGSFDTHVNQVGQQNRLLGQFSEGIEAFVSDLKRNDRFNDVLIMTFSEFGRRVKQNASNGTDHGTANNIFMMSGALAKPGIYNDSPNLNDLDEGDLKYHIDFRSLYATVLNKWLNANDEQILGNKFDYVSVI
jgi:uncharacterized protein (DUF1501 family)